MNKLYYVTSTMTTVQNQTSFDAIDCDMTCAMLYAKKKARRPAGENAACSPKGHAAGFPLNTGLSDCRKLNAIFASGPPFCLYLFGVSRITSILKMMNVLILLSSSTDQKCLGRAVCSNVYDHPAVQLLELWNTTITCFF